MDSFANDLRHVGRDDSKLYIYYWLDDHWGVTLVENSSGGEQRSSNTSLFYSSRLFHYLLLLIYFEFWLLLLVKSIFLEKVYGYFSIFSPERLDIWLWWEGRWSC